MLLFLMVREGTESNNIEDDKMYYYKNDLHCWNYRGKSIQLIIAPLTAFARTNLRFLLGFLK